MSAVAPASSSSDISELSSPNFDPEESCSGFATFSSLSNHADLTAASLPLVISGL